MCVRLAPRRSATLSLMALACLAAPRVLAAAEGEVILWHSYRAGEAQAIDEAVTAFRAEARERFPGLEVRVLQVPFGAYSHKLRSAIPQGNGPDLFVGGHDQLGDLVERRLVVPVAERADDPELAAGFARFSPRTLEPLRRGGALWGWPFAYKTLVLFYRSDLVDAPPKTTDELLEVARRHSGDGRFGFVYEIGNFYYHAPWFFGFGGELLRPDGSLAALGTAQVRASGELIRELVFGAKVTPGDVNGALVTELFNRGKAAMVVNGPWFMSEIAEGVPYGVARLPVVSASGKPARPFSTVDALFMTPRGEGRPEVLALADALTSDAAALLRARLGRQPVANLGVYDDPELAGDLTLRAFAEQLDASMPMPTEPVMQLAWEPLAQALRQIGRGAQDTRAAFVEAQQRIEMLSRSMPPAASPAGYVAALLLVVAGGLGVAVRRLPAGFWSAVGKARVAYVFLLPTVLGMVLFVGVPFLAGIGVGFFAFGPSEVRFVGLANFVSILTARDYGVTHPMSFYFTLGVTMLWTVTNVALHVGLGLAFALLLSPTWLQGRGLFRVLLILPWAVPSYITALVFKGLFNQQLGAVNALLAYAGVEPVAWFDGFWPAFTANLTTNVWLGFPFMMVTVMGALQAIPADLYEAARVDGAGPWKRFTNVTLPLVGPALIPAVVLGTIWTFNMFNVVFLVSEGQPEGATDILVTEAYRWAFARNGQYGYAAAYSLIIFAIIYFYTALTKRFVSARLEAGR